MRDGVRRNENGAYVNKHAFYKNVVCHGGQEYNHIIQESDFYDNLMFLLDILPGIDDKHDDDAKSIIAQRYIAEEPLTDIRYSMHKSRSYVQYWMNKYTERVLKFYIRNKILTNPIMWGVFTLKTPAQKSAIKTLMNSGDFLNIDVKKFIELMDRYYEYSAQKRVKNVLTDLNFDLSEFKSLKGVTNAIIHIHDQLIKNLTSDNEEALKTLYQRSDIDMAKLLEIRQFAEDIAIDG